MKRGYLTKKHKALLMLKQEGKCADCGEKLKTGMFEWDHIQDLQFEGDNELDNWQILCTCPPYRCHQKKTKRATRDSAHVDRIALGKPKSRGFRGWRKFDGTIVRRSPAGE
jgi:5-methylcytosine-specific restriction endonuclease McrA